MRSILTSLRYRTLYNLYLLLLVSFTVALFLLFSIDTDNQEQTQTETNNIMIKKSKIFTCVTEECQRSRGMNSSVLVFTSYRSGSSFIGEMLQRHPDMYYMFEPLKLVALEPVGYSRAQQTGAGYMDQLFHCQFEDLFTASEAMYSNTSYTSASQSWQRRAFCSIFMNKICKRLNRKDYETVCKYRKYIGMKDIVLRNLSKIVPLLDKGLKIIHLVRDPRGQLNSVKRMDIYKNEKRNIFDFASDLCDRINTEVKYASRELIHKYSNYKLIRYEDYAANPVEQAKNLYKFLNIPFSPKVLEWLDYSTKVDHKIMQIAKKRFPLRYEYSTRRDSFETARQWRRELSWEEVIRIQTLCGDVIEQLGYKLLNSERMMNNLNISTTLEFNFYE